MSKTFKIYKHPITSAKIEDSQYHFIDSINGSDSNSGSRNAPLKSINCSTKDHIIVRGNVLSEIPSNKKIIGEGNKLSIFKANNASSVLNVHVNKITGMGSFGSILNCNINEMGSAIINETENMEAFGNIRNNLIH